MPERPTAIGLCGIIFLILGILGIFGAVTNSSVLFVTPEAAENSKNFTVVAMKFSEGFAIYSRVMVLVTLAVALVSMVAGFKLLKGREWARKTAMGLAVWNVINTGLSLWAILTLVSPHVSEVSGALNAKGGDRQVSGDVMVSTLVGTTIGTLIFWTAAAGAVIYFLNQKDSKAFCR